MFRSLDGGAIGVAAPFEQVVAWAAKYGFEGVSVPLQEVLLNGPERTSALLQSHSMRPSVFGLPVDYRGDDAAFERDIAFFSEQARTMAAVGVQRCSTWVLPGRKGMSESEYFELLRNRLGKCAQVLVENGIRLGLEFLGPKTIRRDLDLESDGIYTAERMLELAEAIGIPGTGLLLDAWHWHTSHGTPALFDLLDNELVVDVHVNDAPEGTPTDELPDNRRCLPGDTGVIDLVSFFDGLRGIGYDGPVTVEPFNEELNALPDEEGVAKTAESLRRWM